MPLQERKGFIKDSAADLTIEEKNRELGAALQTRPWVVRKIVLISRVEIGGKGWWVNYRTGTP